MIKFQLESICKGIRFLWLILFFCETIKWWNTITIHGWIEFYYIRLTQSTYNLNKNTLQSIRKENKEKTNW